MDRSPPPLRPVNAGVRPERSAHGRHEWPGPSGRSEHVPEYGSCKPGHALQALLRLPTEPLGASLSGSSRVGWICWMKAGSPRLPTTSLTNHSKVTHEPAKRPDGGQVL